MTASTSRDSDKFVLRLPEGMRDRIRAVAETNNRSMNAEIVATLEEKYPSPSETITRENLEAWGLAISLAEGSRQTALLDEVNQRLAADKEWAGWSFSLIGPSKKGGKQQVVFSVARPDQEVAISDKAS